MCATRCVFYEEPRRRIVSLRCAKAAFCSHHLRPITTAGLRRAPPLIGRSAEREVYVFVWSVHRVLAFRFGYKRGDCAPVSSLMDPLFPPRPPTPLPAVTLRRRTRELC
ncbi:hypothetical protein GOODEAATRI_018264 [Goodea atripinnis]|uniref:Uncharacterized protein n=1 Tax=Goodea atripinnis TaxID=208336 RepID=A0ABV0P5T9_9TELE